MIKDELLGLQKVLYDVVDLVEDGESTARSQLPALIELLDDPDGLPRCYSELESLKIKLETNCIRSGRMHALIWPLKEGEVRQTLDRLGRFHQGLSRALEVDQTWVSPLLHILDLKQVLII